MSFLDGDSFTIPNDGYRNLFPAIITAVAAGSGNFSGYFLYSWKEQLFNPNTGAYGDSLQGRVGTDTVSPAFELNNDGTVSIGSFVWLRFKGIINGTICWEFQTPVGGSSGGGPVTVIGYDPSVPGFETYTRNALYIDNGAGLNIGVTGAYVSITQYPASATLPGYVSTTTQTFGGDKTFTGAVTANYSSVGGSFASVTISNWTGHYDTLYTLASSVTGGGTTASKLGWFASSSSSAGTTYTSTFYIDAQNARLELNGHAGVTGTTAEGDSIFGGLVVGIGTGASLAIGQTITGAILGSILFGGPGSVVLAQDNANLFWDGTNHRLGIRNNVPSSTIDIGLAGTVTGTFRMQGVTSGYIQQQPASAAGSWTFTWPASGGTNLYALLTNGSGIGSWGQIDLTAAVTGTLPINKGGTNNSSAYTAGSVIFSNGTSLVQDNSNLYYDLGNTYFGIGTIPSAALHVKSGTTVEVIIEAGASQPSLLDMKTNLSEWLVSTGSTILGASASTSLCITPNSTATAFVITSIGRVGIKNPAPGALLDIGKAGTTLGTLRLEGDTSGFVQLQSATAAGSWTFTLPTSAGTSNYFLQTNGSGVTTWASAVISIGIGTAITSGTSGSVLYVDASGNLAQDNANLFWDATNHRLGLGTTSPLFGLHTKSSVSAQSTIMIENTSATSYADYFVKNNNGQQWGFGTGGHSEVAYGVADKFFVYDAITDKMRLVVDTSGNVGIGTSTPNITQTNQRVLTICGAATSGHQGCLELQNANVSGTGDAVGSLCFVANANEVAQITAFGDGATDSGRITFYTWTNSSTAAARMVIDSVGNVNIANLTGSMGVGTDASKNLISVSYPTIVGTDRKTGLTAAQALATYTVGAVDTSYQISANVLITSSTLYSFQVTCSYTDESNTARVLVLNFSQLTGTYVVTLTNALGASAYEGSPLHIRCKAATTIVIQSTGTFTSVSYNLEERIIQM